jgi:hypothetical protein
MMAARNSAVINAYARRSSATLHSMSASLTLAMLSPAMIAEVTSVP